MCKNFSSFLYIYRINLIKEIATSDANARNENQLGSLSITELEENIKYIKTHTKISAISDEEIFRRVYSEESDMNYLISSLAYLTELVHKQFNKRPINLCG
jgi:hypothetical protein